MAEDKTRMLRMMKRLTDLRAELVAEYPFFGRLLLHLTPGLANCGTACTDMTHLVFDPVFAEKLSDVQMKWVLLHEILHCALKHCVRGNALHRRLYNVACDIVVNSLIFEATGVSSFSVDGQEPIHLTPDGKEGRNYTAEEVYAMLLKKEDGNAVLYGDSSCTSCASGGDSGAVSDRNALNDDEGTNHGGSDVGMIDCHDVWKDISTSDAETLSDLWEIRIRTVSQSCGAGSGIPGCIKRYLAETDHSPRTNWRQVLADFIKFDRPDYTFLRRDTRHTGDFIMPSFQENMFGDSVTGLWFCVDASGSVSDTMLAAVFSEIVAACNQIDHLSGEIAFFDSLLSDFNPFDSVEDVLKIQPVGGGGTSFYTIFNHLSTVKEEDRPIGIVILTDGYARIPKESDTLGVPVLWIIINSDVLPEYGTVVHIIE